MVVVSGKQWSWWKLIGEGKNRARWRLREKQSKRTFWEKNRELGEETWRAKTEKKEKLDWDMGVWEEKMGVESLRWAEGGVVHGCFIFGEIERKTEQEDVLREKQRAGWGDLESKNRKERKAGLRHGSLRGKDGSRKPVMSRGRGGPWVLHFRRDWETVSGIEKRSCRKLVFEGNRLDFLGRASYRVELERIREL